MQLPLLWREYRNKQSDVLTKSVYSLFQKLRFMSQAEGTICIINNECIVLWEIRGSQGGEYEDGCLLGCCVV
jgi:hypothetical protein